MIRVLRWLVALSIPVALVAVGGCASSPLQYPALVSPAGEARQIELVNTPFYPQDDYQCGPAALATILYSSGVEDVNPARLAEQVYVPALRGSLQAELLGAARRADRVPYLLAPRFADLLEEVRAGHPVLVLQNLRLSRWPQWHYAIVIGFDMDTEKMILRSGTTRREMMSFRRFEHSWRLADYWALVVTQPGALPATATAPRYVEAVAALEQQQRHDAAISAYLAARQRWPAYPMSYLGLGNIAYQRANYALAAEHFRGALRVAPPQPAAHYNLAWTYLKLGNVEDALASARQAEAMAPAHPRYGSATREIIEAAQAQRTRAQILKKRPLNACFE